MTALLLTLIATLGLFMAYTFATEPRARSGSELAGAAAMRECERLRKALGER